MRQLSRTLLRGGPTRRNNQMKYELDPELARPMAALAEQAAGAPIPGRGDWKALRETATTGIAYMATLAPSFLG